MNTLSVSGIEGRNDHRNSVHQDIPGYLINAKGQGFPAKSSIPFKLECSGGIWKGYLSPIHASGLKVRVEGFPPIASHQSISIQKSEKNSNGHPLLLEGFAHAIEVRRDFTGWNGNTEFLMEVVHIYPEREKGENGPLPSWCVDGMTPLMGKVLELTEERSPCVLTHPGDTIGKTKRIEAQNATLPSERTILSQPITITKPNGQVIQAFYDSENGSWPDSRPVVVIAPGYGETKRDYLTLAYYLASNGFQVVRYDHTNHVGASEGDHVHFTLSSMKDDFQEVIGRVRTQWRNSQIIGLASSMAARVAVKAEAETPSVDLLVLLVGIVNVQRTVSAVHLEDVFTHFLKGHYQHSANILGFNVGQ